jgi:hypothetical protein
MNLRKDQRHTVYIIMRAELEKAGVFPDLVSVKNNLLNWTPNLNTWIWTENLPELDKGCYRFYRRFQYLDKAQLRHLALSILDNCIELTY